jgi:hypothetical protein
MPDGERVQIDLTGELVKSYLVQVEGRAVVVDSLDGDPTVQVAMPVMLFLRLTGGRNDKSAALDEIVYQGDGALGRLLVENLAFTI